jgi:hypothetical protein
MASLDVHAKSWFPLRRAADATGRARRRQVEHGSAPPSPDLVHPLRGLGLLRQILHAPHVCSSSLAGSSSGWRGGRVNHSTHHRGG